MSSNGFTESGRRLISRLARFTPGLPALLGYRRADFPHDLIAPVPRRLRHLGLGHTSSVLAVVLVFAIVFAAGATLIGSQFVRMASNFPQYKQTIRGELATLNELTGKRLRSLAGPREASPYPDWAPLSRMSDNFTFSTGVTPWT